MSRSYLAINVNVFAGDERFDVDLEPGEYYCDVRMISDWYDIALAITVVGAQSREDAAEIALQMATVRHHRFSRLHNKSVRRKDYA